MMNLLIWGFRIPHNFNYLLFLCPPFSSPTSNLLPPLIFVLSKTGKFLFQDFLSLHRYVKSNLLWNLLMRKLWNLYNLHVRYVKAWETFFILMKYICFKTKIQLIDFIFECFRVIHGWKSLEEEYNLLGLLWILPKSIWSAKKFLMK